MNSHEERCYQRQTFLTRLNINPTKAVFLAKDMSPRHYFRIQGTPYVLMDLPPPDNIIPYIRVARILEDHHLRPPKVYEFDEDLGFALIEDFGDHTYTYALKKDSKKILDLFDLAMDVLSHLQEHIRDQPRDIELYSTTKLLQETQVFMDWYWPYVHKQPAPEMIQKEFLEMWENYYQNLPQTSNTLVLRDYHIDNLMCLDGVGVKRCGLLDFQDAQWGSVVYDYISLIEDARYNVPKDIADYCFQKFTHHLNLTDRENYLYASHTLGLGRHLKILGVFARYALQHKNTSKIIHGSRVWGYIHNICQNNAFIQLKQWFKEHFKISIDSLT